MEISLTLVLLFPNHSSKMWLSSGFKFGWVRTLLKLSLVVFSSPEYYWELCKNLFYDKCMLLIWCSLLLVICPVKCWSDFRNYVRCLVAWNQPQEHSHFRNWQTLQIKTGLLAHNSFLLCGSLSLLFQVLFLWYYILNPKNSDLWDFKTGSC